MEKESDQETDLVQLKVPVLDLVLVPTMSNSVAQPNAHLGLNGVTTLRVLSLAEVV